MSRESWRQALERRRAEREQLESERRQQTISDVERNGGSLREWQARARREAAETDAKSRFANQQRGTQTERSPLVEGSGAFAGFATPKNKRKEREERQAREAEAGPGTMLELGSKQRYIL